MGGNPAIFASSIILFPATTHGSGGGALVELADNSLFICSLGNRFMCYFYGLQSSSSVSSTALVSTRVKQQIT